MALGAVQKRSPYLWVDKKPVAMAGRSYPTRRGVMIHSVYTSLQSRRHGYAASLVFALTKQLLMHHGFCALRATPTHGEAIRL